MFKEIRATNFKSWASLAPDAPADATAQIDSPGLPLGKVTGLFGANSSGKTSILQILLLLKQTTESADRRSPLDLGDIGSPIRLGAFTDVLRDHNSSARLGLGLSWEVDQPVSIIDPETQEENLFAAGGLAFDTEIVSRREVMELNAFRYWAGNNEISCRRSSADSSAYRVGGVVNGTGRILQPIGGRNLRLMEPVKCYGFPEQAYTTYQFAAVLKDLEFSFEEQFRRTYYLGPLREEPQPTYSWRGARPADVGYKGEGAIPALLAAQLVGTRENFRKRTQDGRRHGRITVEQHVAEWLSELGLVHSFRVVQVEKGAGIYRVYVKRSESSPEVLLTDIGFGVSQILPVLVLLAYVPEGSTVILEQPEIHLHPAVQSGLADVILEAALVRNVQVIVESHSEHLLKRIQLRVAEQWLENGTPVSAADVRLWFIDQPGPVSQAKDLKINDYGEIVNWPQNFFGDPLTETARIARAGLHRRRNAAQS